LGRNVPVPLLLDLREHPRLDEGPARNHDPVNLKVGVGFVYITKMGVGVAFVYITQNGRGICLHNTKWAWHLFT
jgi:hypothetical protein